MCHTWAPINEAEGRGPPFPPSLPPEPSGTWHFKIFSAGNRDVQTQHQGLLIRSWRPGSQHHQHRSQKRRHNPPRATGSWPSRSCPLSSRGVQQSVRRSGNSRQKGSRLGCGEVVDWWPGRPWPCSDGSGPAGSTPPPKCTKWELLKPGLRSLCWTTRFYIKVYMCLLYRKPTVQHNKPGVARMLFCVPDCVA